MSLLNLFKNVGPDEPIDNNIAYERRDVIKNITSFGAKAALSSLPLTLGSLFRTANAQTVNNNIADALNLLLVTKYLEHSFYTQGIDAVNLIPSEDLPSIKQIKADEANHIAFLKNLLGSQAQAMPVFEFNPGGTPYTAYARAFKDYVRFANIAFTFEDLGNRIIQGVINELTGQHELQKQLFNMHSIEARHSSHMRYLFSRVRAGGAEAPWVQVPYNADTNYSFVIPMYYDEENHVQLGISAAEGAFDEPLKPIDAKRILNVFLISPRYNI